jgi:alpha-galactosidase
VKSVLRYKLGRGADAVTLLAEEGRVSLESLFGMAGDLVYRGPEIEGIFSLATAQSPEGHRLMLKSATKAKGVLKLRLASAQGMEVISEWESDAATGVLRRRDKVRNRTGKKATLLRAMPRFPLGLGDYAAYAQASGWGAESQGAWHDLLKGSALEWGCERGRLCQPTAPYLCVAPKGGGDGLALHVMTQGNWVIRLKAVDWNFVPGKALALLEAGLADKNLALNLKPGEELALPEVLLQRVPQGLPELAAEPLHRHLLARDLKGQPRKPPMLFNSWFDRYDDLDPERLMRQARAAKALGCEVFTVDAGWFGRAGLAWDKQVGTWSEKPDAAFRGRMLDFARRIRAMGMGFGLWMEPERVAPRSDLVKRHPEWLIEGAPGREYRLDMEHPQARAWIKSEMKRLISTYGLVWMKVDSNFMIGADPRGRELEGYFSSWWGLLDEIRAEHPGCVIEGCASGALRLDQSALKHHDVHFLSDNVNPRLMLRLLQGTALRVPPSRLTLWAVVKDDGKGGLIGPLVHNLKEPVPVDAAYIAAVCMAGIFTLSGDLLELSAQARGDLRHWIGYWKARREFISSSSCELLTPPMPRDDMRGWAALQLQVPKDSRRLLMAYRLDDAKASYNMTPRGLAARRRYSLVSGEGEKLGSKTGAELMRHGIKVALKKRFSAKIIELLEDKR